jgi:hypothetical protein
MSEATTQFVVSRRLWRAASGHGMFLLLPGEERVGAFPSAAEAEADARAREEDARRRVNPFHYGATWAERCHLPEPVFCDFLRDAGIDPPAEPQPDWASWWQATAATLSEPQRARVWEGLDGVRFFTVAERPRRPVAYAVVEVQWQYNDEWYYPGPEGGQVRRAFRSRQRAEQECARRNAEARVAWRRDLHLPEPGSEQAATGPQHDLYPFDMQERLFPGQDPFGPPVLPPRRSPEDEEEDEDGMFAVDEVPFFEVLELELEEGG